MADPKKDPYESGPVEPAESPTIGTGKRKSPLLARDLTVGRVSSQLDAFINRANEELIDVAESFDPVKREQMLLHELEALVTKLAEAEARAAAARDLAEERAPRWTGMAIAFLIGCAATLGITLLVMDRTTTDAPATQASPLAPPVAAPPAVAAPAAARPPAGQAVVTPIDPPPISAQPPAVLEPPVAPPPTVGVTPPKPPKTKRPPREVGTRPPAGSAAGSDTLYNPF